MVVGGRRWERRGEAGGSGGVNHVGVNHACSGVLRLLGTCRDGTRVRRAGRAGAKHGRVGKVAGENWEAVSWEGGGRAGGEAVLRRAASRVAIWSVGAQVVAAPGRASPRDPR